MKIEILIEKYFGGETTIGEEKILREYFSGKNLPQEHQKYKAMFGIFSDEQNTEISDLDFDNKVLSVIKQKSGKQVVKKLPLYYYTGIAASILVLIGAGLYFLSSGLNHNNIPVKDAVSMNIKVPDIKIPDTKKNDEIRNLDNSSNFNHEIKHKKSGKIILHNKRQNAEEKISLAFSIINDKLNEINNRIPELNQFEESFEIVNKILNY